MSHTWHHYSVRTNIVKLKYATALTLKQIRNEAGLSQEQLARKSGIDRTYISGVERSVRNITLDSLEGLIDALGITSEEFIRRLQVELVNNKSS
ncbi:XRE family transcriptional regulator [Shewanella frigidimarina]|jgi:transcriptional regulator with XRE-family HTH domain|nr:helix-turn-helix transcriptional regulator [Shewanella vesiculosa]NCQ44444.1 helix-turn-helix transcriptional regulator [Shewanella frigidimarina]PIY63504.1 MAG: XRE family transcriptional regulator [Shewanella sp. CG_4_10_14_0_8_um_filter_42_13]PJB93063.1 MAG: XRE family transcriptional regulator [Shewanella sp. CG_4_9_14_0_8_um_filter_42_14]NCP73451.1 helix-turn-helix transcriptional regulator [Shewanella vesiculosa]